ncbi:hypothetical protein ACQUJV_25330 [Ralstonia pseudosolanacearum]
MNPVWIEFPHIPWGSAGWRMGWGEVYWNDWSKWFSALSDAERVKYQKDWPEAAGWQGFYAFVEHGATPQWVLDEREKTLAAAIPPSDAETKIVERYRVKWLLTKYLRRIGAVGGETDEHYERVLYEEPNGTRWLAYFLKPAGVRLEKTPDATC